LLATFLRHFVEIVATAENKVPKVKQETMLWLTRSLNKSLTAAKRATVAKVVKQLGNYMLGVNSLVKHF
jgi:hypothetical protein